MNSLNNSRAALCFYYKGIKTTKSLLSLAVQCNGASNPGYLTELLTFESILHPYLPDWNLDACFIANHYFRVDSLSFVRKLSVECQSSKIYKNFDSFVHRPMVKCYEMSLFTISQLLL